MGEVHTNGAEEGGGGGAVYELKNLQFRKFGIHDYILTVLNTNFTCLVYDTACAKLAVLCKVTNYFLTAKRPSHETVNSHSHMSNTEAKNEWIYNSIPPYAFKA